jgi:hypothetical protein
VATVLHRQAASTASWQFHDPLKVRMGAFARVVARALPARLEILVQVIRGSAGART